MDKHICKIEVFVNKKENNTQFRCFICNKFFNYGAALDHIDRTLGIDEWRRLRLIKEEFGFFKRKIAKDKKRVSKISKDAKVTVKFYNDKGSDYIQIS